MIQIVLIDDHELVRTGFRMILQQQPDMAVCGCVHRSNVITQPI